jgi:arginine/ornithine N-succinyltransferase beta subunit
MAKTLQSAVTSLERDKAQLQSRVNSLEEKLEGRETGNGEEVISGPSAYLYLE